MKSHISGDNLRCRFWLVMIATLVWGNLALANLPMNSEADLQGHGQAITSWIAYLNAHYPQVHVVPLADSQDPMARAALVRDLDKLERYLRGETSELPVGVETLACGPVCGGGDTGKCHTCAIDDP